MSAYAAWAAALDRLEHDVRRAEELAGSPAGSSDGTVAGWTPPAVDGPIPPDLRDRARALAGRQQTVLRAMGTALDATTRQHRLADRLTALASPAPRPVYVDARA